MSANRPPLRLVPHLVSAPAEHLPSREVAEAWGQVVLRLPRGADASVVTAWRRWVAVRRIQLFAQDAPRPEALSSRLGTGMRVDIRMDLASLSTLEPVAPRSLRNQGLAPWILPDDAFLEVTRRAGAAAWPVLLEPNTPVLRGEAPLLALLDHYLFEPDLATPVEPFHSLLADSLGHRSGTLWRVWFGLPLQFFYVDDSGRVALWAASPGGGPPSYGDADEGPSRWRGSAAHDELGALLRGRLPAGCQGCTAARPCGGALLALDPSAQCPLWREVFERIRLAAATLDPARTSPEGVSSR